MLDEFVKVRIRTHLGVPVQGIQNSGTALGYRFFEGSQVGLLEFRMNNLQPYEEATITGYPIAAVSIAGPCTASSSVSVTVNGTVVSYTVQGSDIAPVLNDTQTNVATNFANAVVHSVPGVMAAANPPIANVPQGVFPGYATLIIRSLSSQTLTVSNPTNQGVQANVISPGQPIPVSYTNQASGSTYYGYVQICDYLQSQTVQSDAFAAFTKADVVSFTGNELAKRIQIYNYWRQMLADYMGVPLYPMGRNHRSSGGLSI